MEPGVEGLFQLGARVGIHVRGIGAGTGGEDDIRRARLIGQHIAHERTDAHGAPCLEDGCQGHTRAEAGHEQAGRTITGFGDARPRGAGEYLAGRGCGVDRHAAAHACGELAYPDLVEAEQRHDVIPLRR